MSHTYRYYRQINLHHHDSWDQPQVSGVEEICVDGKRQVHYLNDHEVYSVLQELDSPIYFLTNNVNPWEDFESDFIADGMRYLNPNEVMISDFNKSRSQKANWKNKLAKISNFVGQKANRLTQMAKRLADALKAAWETLNRPG